MGTRLTHVPFDIETSGFETDARVTVVGFSLPLGCRVFLNADGHRADADRLESRLNETFEPPIQLRVHPDERALLEGVGDFVRECVAPRDYLLVAYNGENFRGGFDLPFLRTRYALLGRRWPFDDVPYADVLPLIRKRFNTTAGGEERNDLVTAYDTLVGNGLSAADPFAESGEAVAAFEAGEFEPLLAHNVADVLRTGALASLAERFCGKSEFGLKSLTPSARDPALTGSPGR